MSIVYNSMEFYSYSKKIWHGRDETFCKKEPLKSIRQKVVSFNTLVSGSNPDEIVGATQMK